MLLFKSLKHRLWMLMGSNKYSFIFLKIYCFFRNKELGPVTVSHKTDIVIEGYPRSGNTFAYMSFKNTQNKEVNIAHHVHSPIQILNAVEVNIPVILLIRKPEEAISSLLVKQPEISINSAIDNYTTFYNKLLPFLDKIIIASFDTLILDYSIVISEVNKKYNTSYQLYKNSLKNDKECRDQIRERNKTINRGDVDKNAIGIPTNERALLKDKIIKQLKSEKYKVKILQANKLFDSINSLAF